MSKSYLEHAHVTVLNLDGTIDFLQTAMPDFKVRKRFFVAKSYTEWVHIGTDESYLTLVKALAPGRRKKVLKLTSTPPVGGLNHLLYSLHYFFYSRLKKNPARRPKQLKTGVNHLGFVVTDLDNIVKRLKDKGYKGGIAQGKIIPHQFFRQSYFLSNEGDIEFEFLEYNSESLPERNTYHDIVPVENLA